ncbi:hypothetical protein ACP70R_022952 [Stipagrostis hirtigluma subsp. patula]
MASDPRGGGRGGGGGQPSYWVPRPPLGRGGRGRGRGQNDYAYRGDEANLQVALQAPTHAVVPDDLGNGGGGGRGRGRGRGEIYYDGGHQNVYRNHRDDYPERASGGHDGRGHGSGSAPGHDARGHDGRGGNYYAGNGQNIYGNRHGNRYDNRDNYAERFGGGHDRGSGLGRGGRGHDGRGGNYYAGNEQSVYDNRRGNRYNRRDDYPERGSGGHGGRGHGSRFDRGHGHARGGEQHRGGPDNRMANFVGRGGGRRRGGADDVDDEDYFGDGQFRELANLRQAETPLADVYADKDTAARKEKFKELLINRAASMFPQRPGYGTVGTHCSVRANHFFVRLAEKDLHQYHVTINPESTQKRMYREIMSKLVSERQHTDLGGHHPAYDGGASLYTAGELPFVTDDFEVTLGDNNTTRKERKYLVKIEKVAVIKLEELWTFLAGCPTDIPGKVLQVLDIVLRDIVLNERNNMEYIAVHQSFFSQRIGCADVEKRAKYQDLGLGVAAWKGFYQSIRPTQNGLSLIVDISSTAFIQPLPLIDFAKEVLQKDDLRQFSDMDYDKLKRALRGVRIEVTHRGDERRKYRVAGLSVDSANDLTFLSSSGVQMTVKTYFREKYTYDLQYGFLPCVQVGQVQNQNYLPLEVCKIVLGQQYKRKLDDWQTSQLMKSTSQHPSQREEYIHQVIARNQYSSTKRANEFGIEVDYNSTTVEARVLPSPTLKYHNDTICEPKSGQWNMRGKKVYYGARVSNWACINFCQDLSDLAVYEFCDELARLCRSTGVDVPNRRPSIFRTSPARVEVDLPMCYQNAQRDQKIDLLLAILPDRNRSLYGNIKRICETQIGLMSQCCRKDNVSKKKGHYVANVAIKINAKFGGRNSVFQDTVASLPKVWKKPTIIFGADVTHPPAFDDTAPSISCVVASLEWPEVVRYNGVVRAQGHRKEIINDLEDIIKELLGAFNAEPDKRPHQLIFYRDGVGESQFKEVLEKEIPEIEKAWKAMYKEEKPPQITFIVVQKRHHTRLFPGNYNDQLFMANNGNVQPGTVVDQKMCHPRDFNFFLCSHAAGIKGTSRPMHYYVLRDDNNFTADELQSLTNNLCYTNACCTRSTAMATPAHYAHKLAYRARCYVTQGPDAATAASSRGAAAPTPLPEIRDELKRSMFYC